MTAMRKAFKEAGVETVEDRWMRLCREAVSFTGKDLEAAITSLAGLVRNDVDILWFLLGSRWRQIAISGLRAAGAQEGQTHVASRAGHLAPESAPAVSSAERIATLASAAEPAARAVLMEQPTELGKPVGDLTREECLALSSRGRRNMRFYGWIAQQMPAVGHGVVREAMREEDLASLDRAARLAND